MRFKAVLLILIAAVFAGQQAAWAQAASGIGWPRVFCLNREGLLEAKKRIAHDDPQLRVSLRRLLQEADLALDIGPFSVVLKSRVPPSGNKHDYTSVSPYAWPDPEKPNGLPYKTRDGYTNPEWWQDCDRVPLERLVQATEALALAYAFTGKEAYAWRAAHLLRTWFLDPATAMTPDLEFAQVIPGETTGHAQVIDTRFLPRAIDAIGLLGGSKAWTEQDQAGMVSWAGRFVANVRRRADEGYRISPHNIASFYHGQLATLALFVGDDAQAREMVERTKVRLDRAVGPDGYFVRERNRTNALSYSSFHLYALYNLATLGRFVGVDLWNFATPDNRGLRRALDAVAAHAGPYPPASWPFKETGKTPGDWWDPYHDELPVVLYQAARVYGEKHYEEQAVKILGQEAFDAGRLHLMCGLPLLGQQSLQGWLFRPSSVN